jgi:hypothetical protein
VNALREGFRAVQDNLRALATYGAVLFTLSLLFLLVARAVPKHLIENPLGTVPLLLTAAAVLIVAATQTLVFSWMSQSQGRPLWKLTTKQGFHEFFGLWLLIQTIESTLWLLCQYAAVKSNDDNLVIGLLMACMPVFAMTTPIGASIMHQGHLDRQSVRDAVRVLADLVPQTLVVLMFNGAVVFLQLLLRENTVSWATPLVAIIGVYFDIVVFGATWSLCAHHDRSYDSDDDLDF